MTLRPHLSAGLPFRSTARLRNAEVQIYEFSHSRRQVLLVRCMSNSGRIVMCLSSFTSGSRSFPSCWFLTRQLHYLLYSRLSAGQIEPAQTVAVGAKQPSRERRTSQNRPKDELGAPAWHVARGVVGAAAGAPRVEADRTAAQAHRELGAIAVEINGVPRVLKEILDADAHAPRCCKGIRYIVVHNGYLLGASRSGASSFGLFTGA